MKGIIGKKVGMTTLYNEEGKQMACTVIQAGPCVVTQVKTKDSDGTESVIEKLLLRNLEAVKKLADKEDIDIEKLLKQLKKGE